VFVFSFSLSMLLCVPPGPTQYIFNMPMARYGPFMLKVPLNTNTEDRSYILVSYENSPHIIFQFAALSAV